MNKQWRGVFGLICIFLLTATQAWGQAGTSTVRGEITDPQGKQVAGATVTIKNANTGFTRTQTTNTAGGFGFELIPPGDYSVEVEAKGFKKAIRSVTALVGSAVDADVRLEIGSVGETVQVEATAAVVAVNTEDATLGNNFQNQQISSFPWRPGTS